MMKRVLLGMIGFYQSWVSPGIHVLSPTGCKFHPTCSEYAAEAIEIHGAGRGGLMALRRLMRCHPFSGGGFDPVPLAEHCAAPVSFPQGLEPIQAVGYIGTTEVVPFHKAGSTDVLPEPETLPVASVTIEVRADCHATFQKPRPVR
jgi:putative membrane protein insertion efficiency factor